MDPEGEEPEEVKRIRERIVKYVESKGGSCFVGKWRLSLNTAPRTGTRFLRRVEVKR